MNTSQGGFTFIEWIALLIIIAILIFVGIARYISLSKEANIAAVNGMLGTIRTEIDRVHDQALAQKQMEETGVITFEGKQIALTFSYPSYEGIGALMHTTDFIFSKGVFTLKDSNGRAIANCSVIYMPPSVKNMPPITTSLTNGC